MTILKAAHHPCRPLLDVPSSSAREIEALARVNHLTPCAYSFCALSIYLLANVLAYTVLFRGQINH
jgi:hypothetical protein